MKKLKKIKIYVSNKMQFRLIPAIAFFLLIIQLQAFSQVTAKFFFGGGIQSYTVPCGVFVLHVKAWGAGGSGGGADDYGGGGGGGGGFFGGEFGCFSGVS